MPILSACLIVRDAVDAVPTCLKSLVGVVDEVVAHDTGSRDGTVDRLRDSGAVLIEGGWGDDFAAARNVALARAGGEWILSVDADEVVHADGPALRAWLGSALERRLGVLVRNPVVEGGPGYEYTTVKLFRRRGAQWRGRVHERVVLDGVEDDEGVLRLVPPELLVIDHTGYAAPGDQRRKGERNARLALLELEEVSGAPDPDPRELARAAMHVGRSCIGAGQLQRAVDAFEAVRELAPSGALRTAATDHLARVLLGAGQPEVALVLTDELVSSGVDSQYCSWLRAQGFAQSGRPEEALELLATVQRIVDPSGRRYDPGAAVVLGELCRDLLASTPRVQGSL